MNLSLDPFDRSLPLTSEEGALIARQMWQSCSTLRRISLGGQVFDEKLQGLHENTGSGGLIDIGHLYSNFVSSVIFRSMSNGTVTAP